MNRRCGPKVYFAGGVKLRFNPEIPAGYIGMGSALAGSLTSADEASCDTPLAQTNAPPSPDQRKRHRSADEFSVLS